MFEISPHSKLIPKILASTSVNEIKSLFSNQEIVDDLKENEKIWKDKTKQIFNNHKKTVDNYNAINFNQEN
jgi:hypothetical protein